jgi:hypothetical protein
MALRASNPVPVPSVVPAVLDALLAEEEWPAHFVVVYGGVGPYALARFIVGLERDPHADPDRLRFKLEALRPGEALVRVLGRTEWERMAIELDPILLEGFHQGRVLLDRGQWSAIMEHFQGLADRGLVVKTRLGWRRPGDMPRDPDAEVMARLFDALKPRRRRG